MTDQPPKLRTTRRNDQWWVAGLSPPIDCDLGQDQPAVPPDHVGPYDTKADAEADRVGLSRFDQQQGKR